MKTKNYLIVFAILFFSNFAAAQTLYDVVLGTHTKPITQVQIEFNGNTITQTSGFGDNNIPSSKQTSLPVWMNYIKINDGGIKTLDFFNSLGSYVTNSNMTSANQGIGVYNEGTEILTSPSIVAWEEAMQDMVNSRNALNYLFYDGSSSNPATPPAGDDFDILWKKALTNDDYLVVSERDGNTNFVIVPLGINGNPITSARSLRFGFVDGTSSGNGSKKYDWNIGYGSDGRFAHQGQMFSVVDVSLFNTSQPIYGFRIDNNGQADVKFYGLSDNTFKNNPTNPLVPGLQGNVFNDLDLLNDNTVDGSGISTPGGTQLYASLLSTSNTILVTVPIESDGSYEFLDDVEANTSYKVVLHTSPGGSATPNLPTNWINTGENVGSSTGNDGNVNGIISASVVTTLVTEVNFGIVEQAPVGSIGDTVWYDTDGDGVIDISETPLQGATVTLDPGTPSNTADDVTTTTDANGQYLFDNLPAGNYTVTVDTSTVTSGLPSGVLLSNLIQTYDDDGTASANKSDVTLASGENNLDQDFGYQDGSGSIGDLVWYDANGDGVIDITDSPLEGATVTLDPGTPGNATDDVTTTTNGNGEYLFDNLPAGNYTVTVDVSTVTSGLPTGITVGDLSQTYDADGLGTANKSSLTLAIKENNLDQDFGYQGLGSIGDTVWYDADGDGTQNGTEGGLEGATVTLDPGTPGNPGDDVTTTSDANGNYSFTNLPAGNYTVTVDVSTVTGGLPAGVTTSELTQTFDSDGTGTANTSDVTLAAGEDNVDQDFAYVSVCRVGASVGVVTANDPDADGINNECDLDDDNDGILDENECESLLVQGGFENLTGLNFGNNIGVNIAPWILGTGDQANVVKVDGSGGFDYGQGGPFEDANSATGSGTAQYYLDIASGSNDFYQVFTISSPTTVKYSGYFSSRDDTDGTGSLSIYSGSSGSLGTLVDGSGTLTISSNGDSQNTPWELVERTVNLAAGTYSFVVGMNNFSNFDEGRLAAVSCDTDGDGVPNKEDSDSDGDGCPDVIESGGVDANNDGILDGTGFDNDGLVTGGTNGYNGVTGNENVAHQLAITTPASNQTALDGQPASFSSVASAEAATSYNAGSPIYGTAGNANDGITYQWYLGDPSNGGTALTDSGVYSGTSTATLNISNVNGLDGSEFYLVVKHNKNVCLEEVTSANLTVLPLGSIGDTVWYDTNANGVQDTGENGLEGTTVTLDPGTPVDPSDDLTTTTDANGNYLFDNLPASNYTITVDVSTVTGGLPTGVTVAELGQTYDADGTGTPNTSSLTLATGENNLDQDFGYSSGIIGDRIWYDTDSDGIQDSGEPGL